MHISTSPHNQRLIKDLYKTAYHLQYCACMAELFVSLSQLFLPVISSNFQLDHQPVFVQLLRQKIKWMSIIIALKLTTAYFHFLVIWHINSACFPRKTEQVEQTIRTSNVPRFIFLPSQNLMVHSPLTQINEKSRFC